MYSEAEAVSMLEESVRTAPVIWKGEYPYFIHPLTDGVPRVQVIFLLLPEIYCFIE